MIAKDLISDTISPLNITDTGEQALKWMDVFRVSHLPIVDNKKFLGLISDNDIYDNNKVDDLMKNHHLSLLEAYVNHKQHIYDVFDVVSRFNLSVVPVLDDNNAYLGLISVISLMSYMDSIISMKEKGSVLILELNSIDYSLSEISQIVEENNHKIISLYVNTISNSKKIHITLKINSENIIPILKTLKRYDYSVVYTSSYHKEETEMLETRYKSLMKFLDI